MDVSVEHNEEKCKFTLTVDGQAGGYLTYEICSGCLDIQHTVVKSELRGNRLGEVLLKAATDYADNNGLGIVPTCSYAKKLLGPNKI
ncbi:MAG: N-acetyltransferase [Candidatus Methanoplasma sp.]|jgi:predicted GNAT family acetyltransferase|nr:N-acetyltransferase [Candidatus Methanoplasma sp.]